MHFEINGKQVFATTGGKDFDASLPVVIFLHGSGLDHTFWGLHSRYFAFRSYAVLALDTPGHSNSEGPALGSIEAIADWLNDVVATLGIDNISLVAHSQGCLVALEYASRYTDKLRSVTFIASGLATPVNAALIEAAETNSKAAVDMMIAWGFGPAGHKHQGPIPGNSMAAVGYKIMLRNVPDALATDLKACDAYKNGKVAAEKVGGPIQVILADKDRMAPAKATQELVDHLGDPEVHTFAESGHMVPLEVPNRTRVLLRDFIFANNPSAK